MGNFVPLVFDVLAVLADIYKIYLKNGRLMAFIAVLIISFHTMLYLLNVFSFTPFIKKLIMKQTYQLGITPPGTPQFTNLLTGMENDVKIFVAVEWIFLLITAMASLFFAVSTTYASALIHCGKMISIKDLVSTTIRSLKKPLVTIFYITLFVFGYLFLCLITVLPLALILGGGQVTSSVSGIVLKILATVFYTYLSVVWDLALVVSVLEDKFGIEALGKAAQIVKGMKLQGFILNLLLTILSLILSKCLSINSKQSEAIRIFIAVLIVSSIGMVRMFGYIAFTVLYYRCKKTHGEEVELEAADMEYTKIPIAPLTNENVP
ncbi:hypothetical protein PTKIN_Ptkin03bG0135400 [Pterospermum kingtungense]